MECNHTTSSWQLFHPSHAVLAALPPIPRRLGSSSTHPTPSCQLFHASHAVLAALPPIPRRLGSSTIVSPTWLGSSSGSSTSVTQLRYLLRSLLIASCHSEHGGDDGGGASLLTTGLGVTVPSPHHCLGRDGSVSRTMSLDQWRGSLFFSGPQPQPAARDVGRA